MMIFKKKSFKMINSIIYNYFKTKFNINKMLDNNNIDNLLHMMKNLNFKINTDEYNDMNRELDNFLLKYIKNDINLDINDYKFLSKDHINNEFIENRIKKLNFNIRKLNSLLEYPIIEQRTKEWFEKRKKCLTASDLFDGISKNNILLAKKKAGVYIDNTDFTNIAPLKWGTMFEDMAIRTYSQNNNNIKIHDFGLVDNNNIKNFAASPDGITELGIMIEIKCPYSRVIKKNVIPEKYYYQIQGQLAVCNLDECDYIECDFGTIENEDEYIKYVSDNKLNNKNHGIIAQYYSKEKNLYKYLYSDAFLSNLKCINNINEKIKNYNDNDFTYQKNIYWHLKEIYIQRINFNNELWSNIPDKINLFWSKVNDCRTLPIEYKTIKKSIKYNFVQDND